MNFADRNWLEALYFESPDSAQQARELTVQRFMRKEGGQPIISQFVYLRSQKRFFADRQRG
jgi:hypothetical protein